jgi:hypothetical protein
MARTAKMVDVVVAGRMARMKVTVKEPVRESGLKKANDVVVNAMRQAAEAEFNIQPRSRYRNTMNN